MVLKLFTKKDCPKCPAAKKLVDSLDGGLTVERYDIDTVDGMAEAAFYSVMGTPSIILFDKTGKETASWRGEVPGEKELLSALRMV